jgi:hypothetical protein
MNVSSKEAQQVLDDVEQTMKRTHRRVSGDEAFPQLMLWGAIWFIYPMWIQYWPETFYIPMVLFPLGGIASWLIGTNRRRPVQNAGDKRYGMVWWILFFFAGIWAVLLKPESPEQVYAFGCTVAMFVYVAGGLWWGRFFSLLGLAVTGLTLAGLFLFHEIFWLWMAFMGGGALMGSGLYLKYGRR